MTSERNKLTDEIKKFYWDSENKLIKYEHLAGDASPVDTTALYKYDLYGRRIQKDLNSNVINFMWEGDNLSFELDSSYQPIRKYFTELGMDDYFAHLNYAEVTNWASVLDRFYPQGWYAYIKDQVGTIYKVWDYNAKTVADNRTYDSFGNLISQTGTTKSPLGFQGKYYDQESGLNYFYHRYYNPAIGRFISEDPIHLEGGKNIYAFVINNPIQGVDSYGLCKKCGIVQGPEYDSKTTLNGAMFHWSAIFMNDNTHDPACCEVRQNIMWNQRLNTPTGGLHGGFQSPENQPNTWYEDRDQYGHRYGRRNGPFSNLSKGTDWYEGDEYHGNDMPDVTSGIVPPGFSLKFQLVVVDVCNGTQILYKSSIHKVRFIR